MKSINFAHFPPFVGYLFFLCGCCARVAFFGARMAFVDIVITAHTHKQTQTKLKCTHNDNKFFDKLALKRCSFMPAIE